MQVEFGHPSVARRGKPCHWDAVSGGVDHPPPSSDEARSMADEEMARRLRNLVLTIAELSERPEIIADWDDPRLKWMLPTDTVDLFRVLQRIERESDRGAAAQTGAFLDHMLRKILEHFMIPHTKIQNELFEPQGSLSTFGARVTLAYLLGLIDREEFDECRMLKRIRNRFAHGVTVAFNDADIAKWAEQLRYGTRLPLQQSPSPTPRQRFLSSTVTLALQLHGRWDAIGKMRREPGRWLERADDEG
jgi:hypothetical protein